LRLSPDGRQVVLDVREVDRWNIWKVDLTRGMATRLSSGSEDRGPLWSSDGRAIYYRAFARGRASVVARPADDSQPPRVLFEQSPHDEIWPAALTPDGGTLGVTRNGNEVWVADVRDAGALGLRPLLGSADERSRGGYAYAGPAFSPDGRWIAYQAGERAQEREVFVQPYPGPGRRLQVSNASGFCPAWGASGAELFYAQPPAAPGNRWSMMAVRFQAGEAVPIGAPRKLFDFDNHELTFACSLIRCYDVAPDGRFLAIRSLDTPPIPAVTAIHLVLNWLAELKQKVPPAR
jgi:Tol biopolymer transport system component